MRTCLFLVLAMTLPFSVAADHHRGNGQDGPVSKLFKMADSDKDGQVSYDEHEAFIAMQADKGRERFNKMDSDVFPPTRATYVEPRHPQRQTPRVRCAPRHPHLNPFKTIAKCQNDRISTMYMVRQNKTPRVGLRKKVQ